MIDCKYLPNHLCYFCNNKGIWKYYIDDESEMQEIEDDETIIQTGQLYEEVWTCTTYDIICTHCNTQCFAKKEQLTEELAEIISQLKEAQVKEITEIRLKNPINHPLDRMEL